MITTNNNFTHIDPEEFKLVMESNPNHVLLDVRTADEFQNHHLAKATNADYYHRDFEQEISNLDKTAPYLVYCQSGGRSSSAVETMQKLGFQQVIGLKGGILGWELFGYETVTDESQA